MDEIKTPNIKSTENKPISPSPESNFGKLKIISSAPGQKPLVEGINSPATTPVVGSLLPQQKGINLTEEEKKLINSPFIKQKSEDVKSTIKPQPATAKAGSKIYGFFMFILGFFVASFVWGAIVWYDKPQGILEMLKITPVPTIVTNTSPKSDIPTTTGTESQTPPTPMASSTPEVNLTIPVSEPAKVTSLKILPTPTGYLNIRSEPNTTGSLVGKAVPGETYTFTNTKSGWYEILLPDNKTGWVIATYIEVSPVK